MTKISRIGIICEDDTDYSALKILISRTVGKNNLSTKPKIAKSCSRIPKKCLAMSRELFLQKCDMLIIVRDADRDKYNVDSLRSELETAIAESPIEKRYICVPVEELEAWLLSDTEAIEKHFGLSATLKASSKPETIDSPKEFLQQAIYRLSGHKHILNTKHNAQLANVVSIEHIKKKCPSFNEFSNYLLQYKY